MYNISSQESETMVDIYKGTFPNHYNWLHATVLEIFTAQHLVNFTKY